MLYKRCLTKFAEAQNNLYYFDVIFSNILYTSATSTLKILNGFLLTFNFNK